MAIIRSIGSNIVKLSRIQPKKTVFAAISQVEAYWDGLSEGTSLPKRSDVDPRALESALDYAFVLERIAPGICRFRIAGRHLNDLMGLDVSGMPISAVFIPESRDIIGATVETVCAEPSIKEISLKSFGSPGQDELSGKLLLAPLLDDEGQVTRILGCLQAKGSIGRQPRRFAVTDIHTKELFLQNISLSPKAPAPVQAGFSEPAAIFDPARPITAKIAPPHGRNITANGADDHRALRLVVDNT
ncbi:MAG: PAS domain-containing protein [Paracoccaceae bacterium]